MNYNELYHYGVKGMHWGVRRYQNADGTYTELGRRLRNASRTKKKVDDIFNTLTSHEKELAGADRNDKEWLTNPQGEHVVKRIMQYNKKDPAGFLDIFESDDHTEYVVGTAVSKLHRNKGYATKMGEKGKKWFLEHESDIKSITWSPRKDNTASRKVAEKLGFKLDPYKDTDEWVTYRLTK